MRPLSWSSLRTFEACPLRWRLKYRDKAPPDPVPERASVILGRAVHEALEAYHRGRGGAAAARRALAASGIRDEDRAAAARMLAAFHARERRRATRVLGVEETFRVDLDGVPFTGTVDRLDAVPRGGVAVVDYKSGATPPRAWLPRVSAQLGYYQMGVEKGFGLDVDHVAIEHLQSGLRLTASARGEDELHALKTRAADAWDAMREGPFPAKPNRDCPCEFASRCPYYRDQYPTILDWDGKKRERVADAVEAYAATRSASARAEIEAHMREHGTLRAWGRAHVVERTPGGLVRVRAMKEVTS